MKVTDFGPHSELVMEVIQFARTGRILRPPTSPLPELPVRLCADISILLDYDEVEPEDDSDSDEVPLALWPGQPDRPSAGDALASLSRFDPNRLWLGEYWHRLCRSQWEAILLKFCGCSIQRVIAEAFEDKHLKRALRVRADEVMPYRAGDSRHDRDNAINGLVCEWEINLQNCAESRGFLGLSDGFWEGVFQVYRRGWQPCGWQGIFPEPGRVVAYAPPVVE